VRLPYLRCTLPTPDTSLIRVNVTVALLQTASSTSNFARTNNVCTTNALLSRTPVINSDSGHQSRQLQLFDPRISIGQSTAHAQYPTTAMPVPRASLLSLPAEIRLRIYGCVYQDAWVNCFFGWDPLAREDAFQVTREGVYFATLLVCKQITKEALPALASQIAFDITDIDNAHLQSLSNNEFFRMSQYGKEMHLYIDSSVQHGILDELLSHFPRLERLKFSPNCSLTARAKELQHITGLLAHEKDDYLHGRRDEALIEAYKNRSRRQDHAAYRLMFPDAHRSYKSSLPYLL
jgi:hypothetical protein